MAKANEKRRRKKRIRRKRIVFWQKTGILILFSAAIGGGIFGYNQLPKVRVNRFLSKAQAYEEAKDYTNALASYEEALRIEAGTVKAYRYMANLYLDMEDYKAAEEILYKGISETQDEQIQETYLTVKYNESVNEINEGICTFKTVERLLEILEDNGEKASVYDLLDTCHERLVEFTDEEGVNSVMLSDTEGFGYERYQAVIEKMLSIYRENGKEEMKRQLMNYIAFQSENLAFTIPDFAAYEELVKQVGSVLGNDELSSLEKCLEKYDEVRQLFVPVLEEFDKENFEIAREFLVSDEYIAIRDAFIEGSMDYWRGETYIPFSNIGVYLHHTEEGWGFSFMDQEKKPATQSYLKVWGFKWLDNGQQRTAITYVPISKSDNYFPLTEYCMMYWWSTPVNMELTEATYARMNFRFEENTYTKEGKTTEAINDWGGKYEYRDTYE